MTKPVRLDTDKKLRAWKRMFGDATQRIVCSHCGYAEKVNGPPHSDMVKCPKCGEMALPRKWEE